MHTRDLSRSASSRARLHMLAGAASGLALAVAIAGPASAQDAQTGSTSTAEEEVVVVTGIRASLRNSVNVKRNLDVVAEVVSAEDIGKLPDISIAESIARLPGLAAERVDGRAARISVRGLGPDFTTTLLNGREQVSTNDSRGVEFDQYPSELLSGVNIYKTTRADLSAQGIAGTADLRTIRPLSSAPVAAVSARVQWNSLGEIMPDVDEYGYRLTAAWSDRFMDDTLGLAFGVAYMNSPSVTNRTEAYDTQTTNARIANAAGVTQPGGLGANVFSPGGLKVLASSTVIERLGFMGVMEWRPTDRFSVLVDAYYSTFQLEQNNRGVEINLGQGVNGGWVPGTVRTTDRYVTQGTFFARYAVRNIFNGNEADVSALGVKAEYELSDRTTISFDAAYSGADRETVFIETQPCVGAGCTGTGAQINYSLNSEGAIRLGINENLNDPARFLLADPYGWGAQGFIKFPSINEELITLRFDVSHDLEGGAVDNISFGVIRSDRRKERVFREGFLRTANATTPITPSAIVGSVDLGFGGLGNAIAFSPRALIGNGLRQEIATDWWAVLKDWNVDEVVTTVYFKADIDTEFAGIPTTGNFGLQYIHTEQSSDGLFGAYFLANGGRDGGTERRQAGVSYGELLPSLNLNFELVENFYMRVGASRVLSRPPMNDMRITREINFNADRIDSTDPFRSPYTGDGGNPFLRPTISRNFDISFERYFGQGGNVVLALWQKNLETYLRPGGDRFFIDLSGYPSPAWLGREPLIRTAYVTTPGNAEGGELKGIEFSFNVPLEALSPALEGFGIYGNFAQNWSNVEFADSRAGDTELPGLSKQTAAFGAYYERGGFQVRLNARYRSSFLQEIVAYDANIERRVTDPETIIDAQIGYEFQSGPLEGLSIQLQGLNLGEEPWVTYYENPYRGLNYDEYGTTWMLGVSYKF